MICNCDDCDIVRPKLVYSLLTASNHTFSQMYAATTPPINLHYGGLAASTQYAAGYAGARQRSGPHINSALGAARRVHHPYVGSFHPWFSSAGSSGASAGVGLCSSNCASSEPGAEGRASVRDDLLRHQRAGDSRPAAKTKPIYVTSDLDPAPRARDASPSLLRPSVPPWVVEREAIPRDVANGPIDRFD